MTKLLILSGVLLVLFSSCRKEYIPAPNPNQTIMVRITSGDWRTNDNGVTYVLPLSIPELTYDFNQSGEVLVYISYGNEVYEQIPEVYNNISYSFIHQTGNVTVYEQDLTQNGTAPPGTATIKIVLIPSGY